MPFEALSIFGNTAFFIMLLIIVIVLFSTILEGYAVGLLGGWLVMISVGLESNTTIFVTATYALVVLVSVAAAFQLYGFMEGGRAGGVDV